MKPSIHHHRLNGTYVGNGTFRFDTNGITREDIVDTNAIIEFPIKMKLSSGEPITEQKKCINRILKYNLIAYRVR